MTLAHDPIAVLLEHGEEHGCVSASELSELVARLELDDEDTREPARAARGRRHRGHRRLLARDRGGRQLHEPAGRRGDDRLIAALPERGRPLSVADGRAGGGAREARRSGGQGREGPPRQLEPAARRLDREALPGTRPDAARPDPGRDHRADPRRREVRLAEGVQVLDVRDVVDPPSGAARRREQGAHHPHPRAHRRARAAHHEGGARRSSRSSSAHRRTKSSPTRRSYR